jgi:hypothetical protein
MTMTSLDERWLPSSLRSDYVPDVEADRKTMLRHAAHTVHDGYPERLQRGALCVARATGSDVETIREATGLSTATIEKLTVGWEGLLPFYPPHVEERLRAKKAEEQGGSSAEGEVLAEAAG